MTEHTLSGVDLTNGKRLNLNFSSGDLLGTGDLFDTTKIYEDIKNTNKKKVKEEESKIKKVDTFVNQVETASPYESLVDAYGGLNKLPQYFKPNLKVTNAGEPNFLGLSNPFPTYKVDSDLTIKGVGDNQEVRAIPYSGLLEGKQKYEVVEKGTPGPGYPRIFAGLIDALSFQNLDLDKRGKKFGAKPKLIDLNDAKNYNLSKIEENIVKQELENKGIDVVEEDATSGVDKATTQSIEQQKKQTQFDRGQRLRDALQTAGVNFATMPIYTRILEDAARRRLELDKSMLGAREMMPSNIQNIMASKQYQKNLASSAFAEELKAVAAQQDAATKFAGLGMQRPFGQPNPTSFRV
tara:strand:- start:89 stop:1144 length:1056 start_codon:yes stop_codon:yes gene_type:complete